jgi:hypothetical protein
MKSSFWIGAAIGCYAATAAAAAPPESRPISQDEALNWTRYLVPLPKKIEFLSKTELPAAEVGIYLGDTTPLARQGGKELRECLGGGSPPLKPRFTLKLTLNEAEPALADLPHRDQAYVIRPAEDGDALSLIGGGPRGLYYAAKTMQQLLKAKAADGRVQIPLVKVTDWPDLEDRGLWGGDSSEHIRWMSDRKMNYDEQISSTGVDENKRCFVNYPPYKQKMIDDGPIYGVNPVPVVLHLEQLANGGLFRAYPELQGKDAKPGAICYSNPIFQDLLTQWLLLWREHPGVREVDVWMTENLAQQKGCQCEKCVKEDRSEMEARVIVAAWRKAREKQPDLGLRVLTSEETEKSNPKVFAELPPEVKVWYYHSLFTYNTSEKPMLRRYLVEAASKGRWLGVCVNLCAHVGTWQPFTGAHFVRYRMNEFVDKKFSGLLGYAVPIISHVPLNAEAAAEWAWTAKGRSPREFAFSWAVRQGFRDPEKFAEWSDTHGPVAWDVYGSEWPAGERRDFPGQVARLLKEGKLPALGEVLWDVYPVPWGDIKSVEQMDRDAAQSEKAVRLAGELERPEFLHESRVIQGYMNALKALWELKKVTKPGAIAEQDKPAARRFFAMYSDGLSQAAKSLTAWEESISSQPGRHRDTDGTVKLIEEMVSQMKATASELGCEPN